MDRDGVMYEAVTALKDLAKAYEMANDAKNLASEAMDEIIKAREALERLTNLVVSE